MGFICFDLEGPLAIQDNAYELMKLFPGGDKVFEILSRYDDLLTLEKKEGYEPGDTLSLIVPFLIYHNISEDDILKLAQNARLTAGSSRLISVLHSHNWNIFCISTSYEQYALSITGKLGIAAENVACTSFPLNQIMQTLGKEDSLLVKSVEEEILDLAPELNDDRIKQRLDRFFWQDLPNTRIGAVISQIKPIGGQRKVEALNRFAKRYEHPLIDWVVVGDSITDFKMLQVVNQAQGLAIAFNANEYALPYVTIGLASTNIYDLWKVLLAWEEGHREAVKELVKRREKAIGAGTRGYFHWLADGQNITLPLGIHKKIRRLVREEAAKLG